MKLRLHCNVKQILLRGLFRIIHFYIRQRFLLGKSIQKELSRHIHILRTQDGQDQINRSIFIVDI